MSGPRPQPSSPADRRIEPRFPALRPGKLFVGEQFSAEVLIVDISATGARVRLRKPTRVPSELVLADRQMVTAHRASVVWDRDGELGLKISRSISLKGVVPGPLLPARAWCLDEGPPAGPGVVRI